MGLMGARIYELQRVGSSSIARRCPTELKNGVQKAFPSSFRWLVGAQLSQMSDTWPRQWLHWLYDRGFATTNAYLPQISNPATSFDTGVIATILPPIPV